MSSGLPNHENEKFFVFNDAQKSDTVPLASSCLV